MSEPSMLIWRHNGKPNEIGFQTVSEADGKALIERGVAQDAKTTDAIDLEPIKLEGLDGGEPGPDSPPIKPAEYATRELKAKGRRAEPSS